MPEEFSKRKARSEFHRPPPWVPDNAVFFITINCQKRGLNQLTIPETAQGLLNTFRFYQDQGKWHVSLCLLMPDHLHALISFNNDNGLGMANLIKTWKRYTSRTYRLDWQRDYFDHRIPQRKRHGGQMDLHQGKSRKSQPCRFIRKLAARPTSRRNTWMVKTRQARPGRDACPQASISNSPNHPNSPFHLSAYKSPGTDACPQASISHGATHPTSPSPSISPQI